MKTDNSFVNLSALEMESISILLANDPQLLDFLFTKDRRYLNGSPEDIIISMGMFSSGEQLLIRAALDLWSSSGSCSVGDIIKTLDDCRFESFLLAVEKLRFSNR